MPQIFQVMNLLEANNVEVMTWPPYSPDLSPIENLWSILEEKLHVNAYNTSEQLLQQIEKTWKEDEAIMDSCKKLVEGMPRRIEACVAAKGGVLKY